MTTNRNRQPRQQSRQQQSRQQPPRQQQPRQNQSRQQQPRQNQPPPRPQQDESQDEFPLTERVVKISRVAKVVKGGRHLSFNAVVVVGDMDGHVGIGMGKADAVPDAVRKGGAEARKNIIEVPRSGSTIPHETVAKYIGSLVMLKPAPPGTGVIAGGAVRAVVDLAGIHDIVTKVRRSSNPVNVVKATFKGLQELKNPEQEFDNRKRLIEYGKQRERERAERLRRRQERRLAARERAAAAQRAAAEAAAAAEAGAV